MNEPDEAKALGESYAKHTAARARKRHVREAKAQKTSKSGKEAPSAQPLANLRRLIAWYRVPLFLLLAPALTALVRTSFFSFLILVAAGAAWLLAIESLRRGATQDVVQGDDLLERWLPWRTATSLFAAAGVGLFALAADQSFVEISLSALIGALASLMATGLDQAPKRNARLEPLGPGGHLSPLQQALLDAEPKVRKLKRAAQTLAHTDSGAQVQQIATLSDAILSELREDSDDLRKARRFLSTYLDGALEITDAFAQDPKLTQDPKLAARYARVLTTIESNFSEQLERLRQSDTLDLEVRIEVLERQMKREGLH